MILLKLKAIKVHQL